MTQEDKNIRLKDAKEKINALKEEVRFLKNMPVDEPKEEITDETT